MARIPTRSMTPRKSDSTPHPVEHGDSAVEDAQRALDLDGEVNVTGGVDQVDRVVPPDAGRRGRRDGDAALLLLLHPVHGGRALMNLTDLVVDAGVEQNPLGCGGFARVDMRHDPDVADLGELYGGLGGHCFVPSLIFSAWSVIRCVYVGPLPCYQR